MQSQTKQGQIDGYLEGLLAQVVAHTESVYQISGEASDEELLLSWEVGFACYHLTRQMTRPNGLRIHLSPREQQVAQFVMQGTSNKGIAHILDISPNTVSTHIRRLFVKLGVNSRAEMVACVLRHNLLDKHLSEPEDALLGNVH